MKQIYLKTTLLFLALAGLTGTLKATDYYLKSGTGSVISAGNWGTNPDGTGTSPANFSGNHTWHFANRTGASITGNWSAPNTATAVVEAAFSLTVSGSFGNIKPVINIASTGTLTMANNNGSNLLQLNTLDANSTVRYSATTQSVVPANYGNLIIAVTKTLATNINVYGTLIIDATRQLILNGFKLELAGYSSSISGAGTITGDVAAQVWLSGGNGGNNGTLNFTTGSAILNQLYLQYDNATDYVSLGSNLSIQNTGNLYLAVGSLNLNGNVLTVDNTSDASFNMLVTDGYVMGSSASGLILNGTIGGVSGTTDLFMDPSNNTLRFLTLNSSGGQLDISNALNITDSVSVFDGVLGANGNLTLVSTAALKGRLGLVGTSGSVSGNMTVQTFALAGSTGWTNLGVSGISGKTFTDWYGQIPMAIEGSTTGVTSAGGYYFESVQGWDETDTYGYDTTITVTSPINVGQGYWVYLGNGFTTTTDISWSVSGSPVTGDFPIALTSSAQNGENLIANPYASPISWTALHNGNGSVLDAIYTYYPDNGGGYASFVGGLGTNGGSDVIPMGQAFAVDCSVGTTLMATEGCKLPDNTSANPLLKSASSAAAAQSNVIGQAFKLQIKGFSGEKDETAFRFHSTATPGYDKALDAKKIFMTPGYAGYPGTYSYYTTISSKSGNKDYSINSLPDLSVSSVTVPVLVKVMSTGSYTIAPIDLQNFSNPSCFVLRDKLLNVNHNLANGSYICTISDTTSAPRFELIICQQSIPTSVSNPVVAQSNIFIGQDMNGPIVVTNFEQPTKAVISAYNILGQKIINDIPVTGTETTTHLNLGVHNQAVIIRVTTDKETTVKKMVAY